MSDADATPDLVIPVQVFPGAQEMAQWDALTPIEQRARIERDEEEGFQSGEATPETLGQRLARVRES